MIDTEQRLDKATASLLATQPYWAMLRLKMDLIADSSVDAMSTDGRAIYYNPAYVSNQDDDILVTLLAHEVDHKALGHCWRMRSYDPQRFNVAADHVVNIRLRDAGFRLWPGALCDDQYRGMAVEQVYRLLPESQPEQSQSQSQSQSQPGAIQEPKQANGQALNQSDVDNLAQQNDIDVFQAASAAAKAGKLPGGAKEQVKKMRHPGDNWINEIMEFCQASLAADDYSWRRPDSHYLQSDIFMPTLANDRVGDIVLVVDSSGSMRQDVLARCISVAQDVLDVLTPASLRVIECDTEVQRDREYLPGDIVHDDITGRGGTAFQPLFDYVEQKGYMPACLVYLTDLDCSDSPAEPDYPVLWIGYSVRHGRKAPFGRTVLVKD